MFSDRYGLQWQCSFYLYSYYMYSYYMYSYYKCRVSDDSYTNHPRGLDNIRRGCG